MGGTTNADALELVANWLAESPASGAFSGAGISTESGIPDFRSPGGVWANNRQVHYQEFMTSLDGRREYWRQKAISHADFRDSEPNAGHRILAKWEAEGRLRGVITQNIDGLHQRAGSRNVMELHGTATQVACMQCDFLEDSDPWVERYRTTGEPPDCPSCGGYLKHATISFGQSLPELVLNRALDLARVSQLFLAIGSSLAVEPAASIPRIAKQAGARLVIINRDPTPLDEVADVVIRDEIGAVLTGIDER